VDRHAEAPDGHLLDRRAPQVAALVAGEAARVLPALPVFERPAEAVHRDGQRLVGLRGDGAQRHRARGEALDDLARGLDLLDGNRLRALRAEVQQPAQGRPARGVLVDLGGELGVLVRRVTVPGPHRVLEQRDRLRVPHVVLAVPPPGVDAAHRQERRVRRVPARVAVERLDGDRRQADAADAGGGAGEVALHHGAVEADRLEDLRAVVGLDRRDPHLGDRLEQPLAERLDDVALRVVDVVDARHPARGDELAERLEHEVRVHRARAVADERREVVDLARLARLEDQARPAGGCPPARGGGAPRRRRAATGSAPVGGDAAGRRGSGC
jgi:hypothetical protein